MPFKINKNSGRRWTSRRNAPTQVLGVVKRIRQLDRTRSAKALGCLPLPELQAIYRDTAKLFPFDISHYEK